MNSLRIQRTCDCGKAAGSSGSCESCRKKPLQRQAEHAVRAPESSALREAGAPAHASGGRPLAARLRARLQPLYGQDLSRVRIHDDAGSHARAHSLEAQAYTFGSHVHFAAGRFAPESREGLRLLAHELAHVIQQEGGAARPAQGAGGAIDPPDAPLERAADAAAAAVIAGQPAGRLAGATRGGAQRAIQRQAATPADPGWHPIFKGCSPEQGAQIDSLLLIARAIVLDAIGALDDELTPSPSGIITMARSALLHNFHTDDPKTIQALIARYKRILALLERGPRNVRCLPDQQCDAVCAGKGAPFACAGPATPITVCSGVFDRTTRRHRLFYSVVFVHEAAHQAGAPLHDYDASAIKAVKDPKRLAFLSANVYANFAEDVSVGGRGSLNFHRRGP